MSVQAGAWNFDGGTVDRTFFTRISRSTSDYGPDGEAMYLGGSIGMMYRPFHTTPESRFERQPSVSAEGQVMTWDGRLDNRDELIAQLHVDELADRTDLALVEAAFRRWSTDCFGKFIGDWALSIWDPNSKQVILARDYAGIRQLFYYPKPNTVMWCTYLAPLALCGDQFTLSDQYLAGYLTLWPDPHLTPYREIHPVPPGKFVCIRNGTISVRAHWAFNPHFKTRYKTDTEYEEHFCHLFRQAVRRRLRTDSPILADLSGGLDSSSIVCMTDDILAKDGAPRVSVDTFSFIVNDEPNEEDSFYLRCVEQKRGRRGHNVVIEGLSDASPFECSRFSATPGLTGRLEMDVAKADVIKHGGYRVVLAGTGGDEMLGQALDPRVQIADLLGDLHLMAFSKQLWTWSLLLRRPWLHLFFDCLLMYFPASIRARTTDVARVDPWVNKRFAHTQNLSTRQLEAAAGSWSWPPSIRDWFQTITALTGQMGKAEPATTETRYPFLDRTLVEFLTSIPTEQLLRPGHRRSLMRRALVGVVPAEILGRRTKAGGGRYFSVLLQKHWPQVENSLEFLLISRLGYVKQAEFHQSLVELKHGMVSQYFLRLVRALFLELWLKSAIGLHVITVEAAIALQ